MSTDHIQKQVTGSKARYVLRRNGEEAELTLSILTPHLVIADHTSVPDSFKGTGAGRQLIESLIADARSEGFQIVPLCPFVNAQRLKHPEWADVFKV